MKRFLAMLLVLTTLCTLMVSVASAGKWMQDSTGWWYKESNGSYPASTWKKIKNVWYHFNPSGYMDTGWLTLNGKTYHLASSGAMDTGWKQIGNDWYYFNNSGEMVTNSTVDGYTLGADGKMVTTSKAPTSSNVNGVVAPAMTEYANGFVTIGKFTYYYVNGYRVTGWQNINGNQYYFFSDGSMAQNQWVGDSYFDGQGVYDATASSRKLINTGWTQIQGDYYYFFSNGDYARDMWIGGNYFGSDGRWIPYYSSNYTYDYTYRNSSSETRTSYVGITYEHTFHKPPCPELVGVSEKHLVYFDNYTRTEVRNEGYFACSECRP